MIKYLYIDDDPDARKHISGFENDNISFNTCQPMKTWEIQINQISKIQNDIDGLIIDLRLYDFPVQDGNRVDFRGTALAQEIRTRQKEGKIKPFPIFLFSANENITNSLDTLGRELFDICIGKGSISSTESIAQYQKQMISLAEGYKQMRTQKSVKEILGTDDNRLIDFRLASSVGKMAKESVYMLANFVITNLLEKMGALINEDILAARLGVDIINTDKESWHAILETFSFAKYQGLFSGGWNLWWSEGISIWWADQMKQEGSIREFDAEERVSVIKSILQINDVSVAQKIEYAKSSRFWTICRGTNKPIDPSDGLLVMGQDNLLPWQEREYVSIYAAVRRVGVDRWISVSELEEKRLQKIITILQQRVRKND